MSLFVIIPSSNPDKLNYFYPTLLFTRDGNISSLMLNALNKFFSNESEASQVNLSTIIFSLFEDIKKCCYELQNLYSLTKCFYFPQMLQPSLCGLTS